MANLNLEPIIASDIQKNRSLAESFKFVFIIFIILGLASCISIDRVRNRVLDEYTTSAIV